jgi:putative acetyltransferase
VADADGEAVGHVAISPVTISDGARDWYGLGPVSVLPRCQGRGIGSRLVREALVQLRVIGGRGCVVLGEPAYYARFGFRAEPRLVLPDVPPAYSQALAFDAAGPMPVGTVSYHAAFGATG